MFLREPQLPKNNRKNNRTPFINRATKVLVVAPCR